MKRFFLLAIILTLVLLSVNLQSQADAINHSEKGIISVNTTANKEIAPDTVEISFAIQTNDTKSMQKATVMNKEISDKVLAQLKSMINTKNGDYIKTSDYSARPIYSYSNAKKSFDKYEVSNRITVHTKSIDKVGQMIDNAITAGATNVDNLSFSLSNYDSQCDELITQAAKKAKSRADFIAKNLSSSIIGISTLSTSCNSNNSSSPRLYMAKNMISEIASDSAVMGGTSISDGVIKVTANVNASFYVK